VLGKNPLKEGKDMGDCVGKNLAPNVASFTKEE